MSASTTDQAADSLQVRGRSFAIVAHPVVRAGAAEFTSGFEEGTLRFFDAVLPHCDRMIDCGAYVGFTTLYAATHPVDVVSLEPNPVSFAFLAANVAANPALHRRIHTHNVGIGARDERVMLYAKADADSGSSIHRVVERGGAIAGRPAAMITLRAAADMLNQAGVDSRTLVKIDIEGAEYAVLPAIAELCATRKPWLHVSFHPFNLAAGQAPYDAAIHRLRAALTVAEATAHYHYMHLFADGAWCTIRPDERMGFMRHYLLQPKPLPRIASSQYGFVDAVAFTEEALPPGA